MSFFHTVHIRHTNAISNTQESCYIRIPELGPTEQSAEDIRTKIYNKVIQIQTSEPELSSSDAKIKAHIGFANEDIQDPDQRELFKFYGLMMAVNSGNLAAMKLYLDAGVNPNGPKSQPCMAPLYLALNAGTKPVKLLLEYGAVRNPDPLGPRPLSLLQVGLQIPISNDTIDAIVDAGCFDEFDIGQVRAVLSILQLTDGADKDVTIHRFSYALQQIVTPRSLLCLARRAVASYMGSMPERRDKMTASKLPKILQDDLLSADSISLTSVNPSGNS